MLIKQLSILLLLFTLTSCTANQQLYSTAFAGAAAGGVTGYYVTRDASAGERIASTSALAVISGFLTAWFVTEFITMQEYQREQASEGSNPPVLPLN